jgi:hypothetical protein
MPLPLKQVSLQLHGFALTVTAQRAQLQTRHQVGGRPGDSGFGKRCQLLVRGNPLSRAPHFPQHSRQPQQRARPHFHGLAGTGLRQQSVGFSRRCQPIFGKFKTLSVGKLVRLRFHLRRRQRPEE